MLIPGGANENVEIVKGFFACADRTIWHPASHTVILSDLHLGFESRLRRAGNAMPDFAMDALLMAWRGLQSRGCRRIVVAGDIFHETRPGTEAIAQWKVLAAEVPAPCTMSVLPGNHDPPLPDLERIVAGKRVAVMQTANVGGWLVCHGDVWPADASGNGDRAGQVKGWIVGHQHPAVVLGDGVQREKMLCFARCEPAGKRPFIVLPPFSPAPLGTNLLTAGRWILGTPAPAVRDITIFGIVGTRVLDFGRLNTLCR